MERGVNILSFPHHFRIRSPSAFGKVFKSLIQVDRNGVVCGQIILIFPIIILVLPFFFPIAVESNGESSYAEGNIEASKEIDKYDKCIHQHKDRIITGKWSKIAQSLSSPTLPIHPQTPEKWGIFSKSVAYVSPKFLSIRKGKNRSRTLHSFST